MVNAQKHKHQIHAYPRKHKHTRESRRTKEGMMKPFVLRGQRLPTGVTHHWLQQVVPPGFLWVLSTDWRTRGVSTISTDDVLASAVLELSHQAATRSASASRSMRLRILKVRDKQRLARRGPIKTQPLIPSQELQEHALQSPPHYPNPAPHTTHAHPVPRMRTTHVHHPSRMRRQATSVSKICWVSVTRIRDWMDGECFKQTGVQ